MFSTTGALPTGLTAGTPYFAIAAGLSGSQFEVSATSGGSAINTSGTQSGVHTATIEHILSSQSTPATYVFIPDTVNLAILDLIELRVYDKVDGTNFREVFSLRYQHLQGGQSGKAFAPVMTTSGFMCTLKQLAGTGRAIPWSLRTP